MLLKQCAGVFLPGAPVGVNSSILGSNNYLSLFAPAIANATENGWARLSFKADLQSLNPISGQGYMGLPVIGFAVQQFTNAGAAEGLLAQYGVLFKHKKLIKTDDALND